MRRRQEKWNPGVPTPKPPESGPRMMNGGDFLERGQNKQDMIDARKVLFMRAADAREDLVKFFEFVMREEKTKRKVKAAPHQRVAFKFMTEHVRAVLMMPVGHSKTFMLAAYTLWSLGRNPSMRGAIVSATQGQAEKVVAMVRDYILTSPELRMVFPDLVPSDRKGDHWTQTSLVIKRPAGIRDASLVAFGMDGATPGSRLEWVIVDDMLNAENTRTKDGRDKVKSWIESSVVSRLEVGGEKLLFSNTPWHPEDLVCSLQKGGWATLKMDVAGYIHVYDDVEGRRTAEEEGREFEPWDSDELRPAYPDSVETSEMYAACRLVAHDPDPRHQTTLWPARMNRRDMGASRRQANDRQAWLRNYMCQAMDDSAAWCKEEDINLCKALARKVGHHAMQGGYDAQYINRIVLKLAKPGEQSSIGGPYQVFIGVDLAFSERDKSDDTAFFTFVPLPSGHRLILDIEIGKWPTTRIMEMVLEKNRQYNNAIVTVENNGAQRTIRDFVLKNNVSAPIKAFTTGKNKANPDYGLPSIFVEVANGAWLIPNDKTGTVHPHVQKWIDGLRQYVPSHHTSDALMAMFFAREQARKFGMLSGGGTGGMNDGMDLDFTSR